MKVQCPPIARVFLKGPKDSSLFVLFFCGGSPLSYIRALFVLSLVFSPLWSHAFVILLFRSSPTFSHALRFLLLP